MGGNPAHAESQSIISNFADTPERDQLVEEKTLSLVNRLPIVALQLLAPALLLALFVLTTCRAIHLDHMMFLFPSALASMVGSCACLILSWVEGLCVCAGARHWKLKVTADAFWWCVFVCCFFCGCLLQWAGTSMNLGRGLFHTLPFPAVPSDLPISATTATSSIAGLSQFLPEVFFYFDC